MIDSNKFNNNCPIKWKKHLVLVEWGLREKSHLFNTIKRYKVKDYNECLEDIRNSLEQDKADYAYIIKLVYKTTFHKLPNIIIKNIDDLNKAKKTLSNSDLSIFDEIWYCRNIIKKNDAVFGRLLIGNNYLFPNNAHIVYEMVWDSSARSIEKYPNMNCPFAAAYRNNWNAPIQINEIISSGSNEEEMKNEVIEIIKHTSRYQNAIKDFGRFVFSCGCQYFNIEFTYYQGDLKFIDWDSDNDLLVINRQFSK